MTTKVVKKMPAIVASSVPDGPLVVIRLPKTPNVMLPRKTHVV